MKKSHGIIILLVLIIIKIIEDIINFNTSAWIGWLVAWIGYIQILYTQLNEESNL